MGRVVELVIPARRDHLALVRLVVESVARIGEALPEGQIDDLRLAVSEGCANAVDAQSAAGADDPIVVTVEVDADAVVVTVTDRAGGFDVEAVERLPSVTDPHRLRHERGLGIQIMRSLVDEVTYTPTADGTALRLVARA